MQMQLQPASLRIHVVSIVLQCLVFFPLWLMNMMFSHVVVCLHLVCIEQSETGNKGSMGGREERCGGTGVQKEGDRGICHEMEEARSGAGRQWGEPSYCRGGNTVSRDG